MLSLYKCTLTLSTRHEQEVKLIMASFYFWWKPLKQKFISSLGLFQLVRIYQVSYAFHGKKRRESEREWKKKLATKINQRKCQFERSSTFFFSLHLALCLNFVYNEECVCYFFFFCSKMLDWFYCHTNACMDTIQHIGVHRQIHKNHTHTNAHLRAA